MENSAYSRNDLLTMSEIEFFRVMQRVQERHKEKVRLLEEQINRTKNG